MTPAVRAAQNDLQSAGARLIRADRLLDAPLTEDRRGQVLDAIRVAHADLNAAEMLLRALPTEDEACPLAIEAHAMGRRLDALLSGRQPPGAGCAAAASPQRDARGGRG